jgi:hypothetical protein
MVEFFFFKIKNLAFSHDLFEKFKVNRQNVLTSVEFRGRIWNSEHSEFGILREILANFSPHTESTEVKKRYGIPC